MMKRNTKQYYWIGGYTTSINCSGDKTTSYILQYWILDSIPFILLYHLGNNMIELKGRGRKGSIDIALFSYMVPLRF